MKKKTRIASQPEQKSIIDEALKSSENEQLDLYKAIFGGIGADCPVVAVSNLRSRASAYDKHDTFLQAIG
ncbi:hypothetical protein [Chitinophaga ginsengisoli]|uniref:Uncharacterized protein n=1 Tax=Chitinophaga ginsengisoli TaxID=363837 RepID=A0A2P8GKG0_9BACT|nr:hypothetical protein [Chitinophaga ginsengisoli]PSL34452.1 hypothetical protein CLV42_10223 [Chitinophaga ginsengisoli]